MDFFKIYLKNPIRENLSYCTLNSAECSKIDPDPDRYLNSAFENAAELPPGVYYFTQERKEILENEKLLTMVMELQKEGLWERLKLEEKLYVRRLFEDGSPVTQIWRPVKS
jgi:hypothetical protein